jgi:hypothetical protein
MGKNVRSNLLVDKDLIWMWFDGQEIAYQTETKLAKDAYSYINRSRYKIAEPYNYKCENEIPDEKLFILPDNVEFYDLESLKNDGLLRKVNN